MHSARHGRNRFTTARPANRRGVPRPLHRCPWMARTRPDPNATRLLPGFVSNAEAVRRSGRGRSSPAMSSRAGRVATRAETRLQMIASDDIGRFCAAALSDQNRWNRAEVNLAGDDNARSRRSTPSEATGRSITYQPIPLETVRQNNEDLGLMFAWFETTGFAVDIAGLNPRWGVSPWNLGKWLKRRGSTGTTS